MNPQPGRIWETFGTIALVLGLVSLHLYSLRLFLLSNLARLTDQQFFWDATVDIVECGVIGAVLGRVLGLFILFSASALYYFYWYFRNTLKVPKPKRGVHEQSVAMRHVFDRNIFEARTAFFTLLSILVFLVTYVGVAKISVVAAMLILTIAALALPLARYMSLASGGRYYGRRSRAMKYWRSPGLVSNIGTAIFFGAIIASIFVVLLAAGRSARVLDGPSLRFLFANHCEFGSLLAKSSSGVFILPADDSESRERKFFTFSELRSITASAQLNVSIECPAEAIR